MSSASRAAKTNAIGCATTSKSKTSSTTNPKTSARVKELCPKGVDIFFDNVGGEQLDIALARLAMNGRIVLCGAISQYGDATLPPGPKNYTNLIVKRGRMEGFLVSDHMANAGKAIADLAGWVGSGKIVDRVDIQNGLENAPKTLNRLFTGANIGKQLLKIADE
jgi:NADPH-dependent curcumin reductase